MVGVDGSFCKGGGFLFWFWRIRRGYNVFLLKVLVLVKIGREVGVRGGFKGYSRKVV